jgi:hypothetical protein
MDIPEQGERQKLRVAFIHPDLGIGVCCTSALLTISNSLLLFYALILSSCSVGLVFISFESKAGQNVWWSTQHWGYRTKDIRSRYIHPIMIDPIALTKPRMVSMLRTNPIPTGDVNLHFAMARNNKCDSSQAAYLSSPLCPGQVPYPVRSFTTTASHMATRPLSARVKYFRGRKVTWS